MFLLELADSCFCLFPEDAIHLGNIISQIASIEQRILQEFDFILVTLDATVQCAFGIFKGQCAGASRNRIRQSNTRSAFIGISFYSFIK